MHQSSSMTQLTSSSYTPSPQRGKKHARSEIDASSTFNNKRTRHRVDFDLVKPLHRLAVSRKRSYSDAHFTAESSKACTRPRHREINTALPPANLLLAQAHRQWIERKTLMPESSRPTHTVSKSCARPFRHAVADDLGDEAWCNISDQEADDTNDATMLPR